MKGLQLPLGVQLADASSFDSYHAGPNAEPVAALRALISGDGAPLVFLYGPHASGRSHLLQALTREASRQRLCAYLPLAQLRAGDPAETVSGLHDADLVCLDDLDAVAGDAAWSIALLRLLDALRAHGGSAVVAAGAPPERLAVALPDLRTRLSAAAVYGLKPLDDEARETLLLERARARGLDLPQDAARALLARLPRDAGSLVDAIERLDCALLSAQRRLTIAFVQQWLREQE
ncbi:MAG TPA: DnaA regulatory inactivator Hda [Verrucomicrobiae bacterium]|nr:DnaA regulatory inactivator Hda [Verrucomicrobiae bacterium]